MPFHFGPSQRALATFHQGHAWDLMGKVKQRPQYDQDSQPDGIINLSGATNALMDDWMDSYVKSTPPLTIPSAIRYGPMTGSDALLDAAAGFINCFFRPYIPVTRDNLLAANGVTSLIDMVAWTLCNPGEGVVYMTPNFYMLDYDLSCRAGVNTVPVSTSSPADPFVAESSADLVRLLNAAVDDAGLNRHVRCSVLFICNPANPQGRCYSPQTLQALASWCLGRGMHLVSDEIYAMSSLSDVGDGILNAFSSVLCIPHEDATQQQDHIHCLYGLSKDFNMGGLRMAFLVTRNNAIRTATSRIAWFTWLTVFSDTFVTRFLEDTDIVKDYLNIYQERLRAAYARTTKALLEVGIQFAPSNAGLFLWIDLSDWICFFPSPMPESQTPSRETQLCEWLVDHGVFLNAGEFAGSDRPGHFRLVFAQYPEATIAAIKRIRVALNKLESTGLGSE